MTFTALQIADACIQAGELDAALTALADHLATQPADDDARRTRIALLQRLGATHRADALADIDRLATLTADDHAARAVLLEAAGDAAGAAAAISTALRLRPGDPVLTERRVDLLLAVGRSADAIALLDSTLMNRMPGGWRWRLRRGDAYHAHGDPQAAVADYAAALTELSAMPDAPALIVNYRAQAHIKRATVLRTLRQWAAADADLAAAERLLPTDPVLPFLRGLVAYALGGGSHDALRRALPVCRDALDRAGSTLRREMKRALMDDPLYRPLAAALEMNQ